MSTPDIPSLCFSGGPDCISQKLESFLAAQASAIPFFNIGADRARTSDQLLGYRLSAKIHLKRATIFPRQVIKKHRFSISNKRPHRLSFGLCRIAPLPLIIPSQIHRLAPPRRIHETTKVRNYESTKLRNSGNTSFVFWFSRLLVYSFFRLLVFSSILQDAMRLRRTTLVPAAQNWCWTSSTMARIISRPRPDGFNRFSSARGSGTSAGSKPGP